MKKKTPEPKTETIYPFDDIEFFEKWQEWLLYRKQRKIAAYVPIGLNQTFRKLFKESGGDVKAAIAMIDQSIGNGWQGLFPLRNNNTNGHGSKQPITNNGIKDAILSYTKGGK